MRNWFEMGIMKYWSPASSMSKEVRRQHLEQMINSGNYLYSRKYDGNFSRAIITADRNALQTRGISKKTGTYGEIQDKVFFWDSVVNAFQNGDTVILGEAYLPGGVDKDTGSILRCLVDKALARQKDKKIEWRIFDVLALDGRDMVDEPIEERVKYIPEVVERINNPLVQGIPYYEMQEDFFDKINEIFADDGEGVVCYKKGITYTPDKRSSAWTTVKVKQEITDNIDAFIIDIEPATRTYTGKDVGSWELWENTRTGEKVCGLYFSNYQLGEPYEPVTKNYFFGWPGAIYTGVYDKNHNIVPLCKVAGLTEELKTELRDNFNNWYLCPVSLSGMALSDSNGLSIRHPRLVSIRRDDISPEDCTLEKILG